MQNPFQEFENFVTNATRCSLLRVEKFVKEHRRREGTGIPALSLAQLTAHNTIYKHTANRTTTGPGDTLRHSFKTDSTNETIRERGGGNNPH